MAGVEYEPSVKWTPDALIGELERRVEIMADALDELRGLLQRLTAEQNLQNVLGRVTAAGDAEVMAPEGEAAKFAGAGSATVDAAPATVPVDDAARSAVEAEPPRVERETPLLAQGAVVAVEVPDLASADPVTPESLIDKGSPDQGSVNDGRAPLDHGTDDSAREEVRRAVEMMRNELENAHIKNTPEAGPLQLVGQTRSYDDDIEVEIDVAAAEAAREDVRRAVEEARRELARGTLKSPIGDFTSPAVGPLLESTEDFSGWSQAAASDYAPEPRGGHAHLPSRLPDSSQFDERQLASPSIVIEDPGGRVELVHVYETLSRVNCSGQAVLLNYTPHSVTVGIGAAETPDEAELAAAVRHVFGRACRVSTDGVRLAVTLNHGRA